MLRAERCSPTWVTTLTPASTVQVLQQGQLSCKSAYACFLAVINVSKGLLSDILLVPYIVIKVLLYIVMSVRQIRLACVRECPSIACVGHMAACITFQHTECLQYQAFAQDSEPDSTADSRLDRFRRIYTGVT